jgi:hypothetical protein
MTNEKVTSLVAASRVLSALSGLIAPFILWGVIQIYGTLNSYGNRLTALEVKATESRVTSDAMGNDIRQLKTDYYSYIINIKPYLRK